MSQATFARWGVDQEGTLASLKRHRSELTDPKVKVHRGRILKRLATSCLP
jgi:hypothetical protein